MIVRRLGMRRRPDDMQDHQPRGLMQHLDTCALGLAQCGDDPCGTLNGRPENFPHRASTSVGRHRGLAFGDEGCSIKHRGSPPFHMSIQGNRRARSPSPTVDGHAAHSCACSSRLFAGMFATPSSLSARIFAEGRRSGHSAGQQDAEAQSKARNCPLPVKP
jgi:hypothetical protein